MLINFNSPSTKVENIKDDFYYDTKITSLASTPLTSVDTINLTLSISMPPSYIPNGLTLNKTMEAKIKLYTC